jgi:hypothetical protein
MPCNTLQHTDTATNCNTLQHATTQEGQHNSKLYNESTLLLVLKHMIYSLTHPTLPLQDFIRHHFRQRGPSILRRCQRILDKVPVAECCSVPQRVLQCVAVYCSVVQCVA